MIIDCHTHIAAVTKGHGFIGPKMRQGWLWQNLNRRYNLDADPNKADELIWSFYDKTIQEASRHLDKAVIFAFDDIYTESGVLDPRTSYSVSNKYTASLVARSSRLLLGASVHPYRPDALVELDKVVKQGAVLIKWLPPVQGMDPDSPLCLPFYEALAHYKLPLLCHTGSEHTLPMVPTHPDILNPMRLRKALDMGVTVICAHAGSSSWPFERDYSKQFARLAQDYEHCYGDTAAMALPFRMSKMIKLFEHPVLNKKMLHGSDFPVFSLPLPGPMTLGQCRKVLREPNSLVRDCLIKKSVGADEAYWRRAAEVLRLP